MAVDYLKKGTIQPIHYWQNEKGHIILMSDRAEELGKDRLKRYMDKLGYMPMCVETLQEAEKLQNKLQEQLKREQEYELAKDEHMTNFRRSQVRDRLVRRMNSASCSQYERDFIKLWLEAREQKHEIFRKRFTQQIGHLDALEFDNPNQHIHSLLDKT